MITFCGYASSYIDMGTFAWSQTSLFLFSGGRMHAVAIFDRSFSCSCHSSANAVFCVSAKRPELPSRYIVTILCSAYCGADASAASKARIATFELDKLDKRRAFAPSKSHVRVRKNHPIGQTHDSNHRLGLRLPEHKESRTLRQSFKSKGR